MTEVDRTAAGIWRAIRPSESVPWLASLTIPWWIAGGWALDLYAGNQSRPHGDLDIGVLRRDALEVLSALHSWEFFEAKEGVLTRLCKGESPRADVNSIWGRPAETTEWTLEVMLDESDGDRWVFRRQPRIRQSLAMAIRHNSEGIPYLAPEIQLLYKARSMRPQDQADFDHIAPRLAIDARTWLRDALAISDPNHSWLLALDSRLSR
jgi:hypothetical protein